MRKRPRKLFDWAAMQAYIDAGNGYPGFCHRRFGIAHATWMKAIALGDIAITTPDRPHGSRPATVRLGRNPGSLWWRGKLSRLPAAFWLQLPRQLGQSKAVGPVGSFRKPLKVWTAEEALAYFERSRRLTIKNHLLKAGIIINRCDLCGLSEWRGRPLSIQIDHVNGIHDDHRLENLRMLCPNCHSQTDTFAGRNVRVRKRHSRFAKW